ncbi:MAG: GNAT family protein [Armatimonadota bacterium]
MKSDHYLLIQLVEEHFSELHRWNVAEKHMELYTCQPVTVRLSEDAYIDKMRCNIRSATNSYYVLVAADNHAMPLGKIRSFDYNPRNHSAEFGYYLPAQHRGCGLGSIMLRKFLDVLFTDSRYDLNKLYATTSSNNIASIRLLEKYGFKLDGRQREHYWVDGNHYDQLIYSILRSEWEWLK